MIIHILHEYKYSLTLVNIVPCKAGQQQCLILHQHLQGSFWRYLRAVTVSLVTNPQYYIVYILLHTHCFTGIFTLFKEMENPWSYDFWTYIIICRKGIKSGGRRKISSGNFHSSLTFVHFSCTKNSTLKMRPTLRHLCYVLFGM